MWYTACPRSSDQFYIVDPYTIRATTSWAYSTYILGPKFKDALTDMGATFLNYKDDNYARDLISLSGKLLVAMVLLLRG